MPSPEINTGYYDSNNLDLGKKLISKDYLISVYPQIANQLITPELWTWGQNSSGQLADNTTTIRCTPVTTLAGGANWKQVYSGYNHTTAIKTDGTLWVWGNNGNNRLGDNTIITRSTPVTTFAGGTNWKQVSCGNQHSAAIKTDGTLWTWGLSASGQLGINDITNKGTPVTTFAGGTNWKQVECGRDHVMAIKTDGTLWGWGSNAGCQLGVNDGNNRCTPVTTFAGGNNWKQVSAMVSTLAVKTDGTLWGWGDNTYGQLGDNTTTIRCTPVTTFAGGTNWKQVVTGQSHTSAIKTDGTLWGWGGAITNYGQLGDNTTVNRSTPVTTFAGGTNWKQVSCGGNHTAAIKTDGTLWGWGFNGSTGRLGINDVFHRSTPVTTFAGGTNWKQVSCKSGHIVAIKTSDDLQGI